MHQEVQVSRFRGEQINLTARQLGWQYDTAKSATLNMSTCPALELVYHTDNSVAQVLVTIQLPGMLSMHMSRELYTVRCVSAFTAW